MLRDLELLLEDAIWLYFTERAPLGPYTLANSVIACLREQNTEEIQVVTQRKRKVWDQASKVKSSELVAKGDSAELFAQIQLIKAGELLTLVSKRQANTPFLFKMWFHGANPGLILPDSLRLYQLSQMLYPNMILLNHQQKKRYGLEVLKISKEAPHIINPLISKILFSMATYRQRTQTLPQDSMPLES